MTDQVRTRYELRQVQSNSMPWQRAPGKQVLWIGCSDSDYDELETLGLQADQVLEYRNLGNMVIDDLSCQTTLGYALELLKIRDIVVCGHYGCHIVQGKPNPCVPEPWSRTLDMVRSAHNHALDQTSGQERDRAMVELNILGQVQSLSQAHDHDVQVFGVVYDRASKTGYQITEAGC
ncbi:putative carbonate dehydratase [Aspergillus brunneoviolaceus CBS 621.78]|uniref:Carbonate dehydratase n=1 Tax=Aspergillus brunneoviolaceus CBS 621.78 TaxID=1450534 RepID=A0ACD1GBL5_9EURO|nr:putative carbonate dehydratase [Aspergillus brunneoviolaceus CBS 621.78]RAH46633.1 putative carbonate dehydratase [Aspergillus brunneoviolaceus CBS 621.78]